MYFLAGNLSVATFFVENTYEMTTIFDKNRSYKIKSRAKITRILFLIK